MVRAEPTARFCALDLRRRRICVQQIQAHPARVVGRAGADTVGILSFSPGWSVAVDTAAFLLAGTVCWILVPLVRKFAARRGLFDQATNSRKVHVSAIPRLGGIAIVAGFFAPFLALLLVQGAGADVLFAHPRGSFAFIAGGLAIAALGLFDDLFGSGAKSKFAIQGSVALYLWAAGFRIEQLQLPGGDVVSLGWFGIVLTVGWIVGVMNAINLIDGLDGLAAGVALIAVAANFFLARAMKRVLRRSSTKGWRRVRLSPA